MNPEVVISGAWQGFEKGVKKWAAGTTRLSVSRKMGMVLCSSDDSRDLDRLRIWLTGVVASGAPQDVASFESALFPPTKAGGNPTLVRGLAEQRKEAVLEHLPNISSTPRSMFRSKSRAGA